MRTVLRAAVERASANAIRTSTLSEIRQANDALLLGRAQHLDPEELGLLMLAVCHGMSIRQIAGVRGGSHGAVARRLVSIRQRLLDPRVAALTDPACPLPALDRELALDRWLRRRSYPAIAANRDLAVREVRRRVQWVRGWVTGRRDGARAARAALCVAATQRVAVG